MYLLQYCLKFYDTYQILLTDFLMSRLSIILISTYSVSPMLRIDFRSSKYFVFVLFSVTLCLCLPLCLYFEEKPNRFIFPMMLCTLFAPFISISMYLRSVYIAVCILRCFSFFLSSDVFSLCNIFISFLFCLNLRSSISFFFRNLEFVLAGHRFIQRYGIEPWI